MKSLQEEIDDKKKEIFTDGYPMSIGELSNIYRDNELDIHPEFQRFFRWTILQKSKLIESILLGIPIPSIFVSQREDGVWDVVDGLQRLSTIFQFMGILRDTDGNLIDAKPLVEAEYLKSLNGKFWNNDGDKDNSLSPTQRISFKREKIDIKIVKKESHNSIKFELFQRLNTLGSRLSDQEVRNCLLVLLNDNFYNWLRKLSNDKNFLNTLSLNDRLMKQQYNMELALRFLIFKRIEPSTVKSTTDLGEFVTNKMRELATNSNFQYKKERSEFLRTFEILNYCLGEDTFKRYDAKKGKFGGKFLISAFEAIGYGLGRCIDDYKNDELSQELATDNVNKIISIWADKNFQKRSGSGIPVTLRVPTIIPIGEETFKK
jgi:hypothetical protein